MKKEFIGYYPPTNKEINDAWDKGIFAFDANTLLNLYRYSDITRKDFISALQAVKEKLFIPFQAASEYQSNRLNVIDALESSYNSLNKILTDNFENSIEPQINQFKRHPSIVIERIVKLHADFLKQVSKELQKQKSDHPDFKTNDSVLNELTKLFENAVGKEFSKAELQKIYSEGKERYADSIPPGYRDLEKKKKKGDKSVYADLVIWKELINFTIKERKPMIFITDDRKEDWWTIENGKTLRPREELIKEFYDKTDIRILIYNADQFLMYAKEKLVPAIKNKTIEEVKEIRVTDEDNINFDNLYSLLQRGRRSGSLFNMAGFGRSLTNLTDQSYYIGSYRNPYNFLKLRNLGKYNDLITQAQQANKPIDDSVENKPLKDQGNSAEGSNVKTTSKSREKKSSAKGGNEKGDEIL